MSARKHTLISFDLCPFVQRSSITLQHNGIAHEIRYIDLFNKPDWFLEISPFGKVPLLVVEEEGDETAPDKTAPNKTAPNKTAPNKTAPNKTVLFESAVINEYLDDIAAEAGLGRLHPEDALTRALHRAWIEFGSSLLVAGYQLSMAMDDEALRERLASTRAALARFEAGLGEGPFFAGADMSLIDTAVAPALQRLLWLDELWPELGIFAETPKVRAWGEHLISLDVVKRSTVPDIQARFHAYLQGKGTPTRDAAPSVFGQRVQ